MSETKRKKKVPSEKLILSEIAALKELLPKIRPFTAFGADNRTSLRAQIRVLEERLTEDEVFDAGDWDNSAALLEAARWLEGDSTEKTLSEGWKELVTP